MVPSSFADTASILGALGISTGTVATAVPSENVRGALPETAPSGIQQAASTALACDADMVITENSDWYPYYKEFEDLHILLGSFEVIPRQAEIFALGWDIPWSFRSPVLHLPWGLFYFFAESDTLRKGQAFLNRCYNARIAPEVQEIGRSLVFNRIPNILFTRDRLLFYDMQQAAAKRKLWKRQKFQFEVGYFLNFYYVLLFGAFDHLAALANGILNLGLKAQDVGASKEVFLKKLRVGAPEIHTLFTSTDTADFIERIASLRHSSAHRDQIMPGPIYERPESEPSIAELDEEIREKGLDSGLEFFPPGPTRDGFKEMIRFHLRISKWKVVLEDAVFLNTKKIKGVINPLIDTEWNFSKFYAFFSGVLGSLEDRL